MAVIIPSSKIYNIEDKKIIDNKINEVNIKANNISTRTEYHVFVHKHEYGSSYTAENQLFDSKGHDSPSVGGTGNTYLACIWLTPGYYNNIRVVIPKTSNNKLIKKIYTGKDTNDNPNISHTVTCDVQTGTAKSTNNTNPVCDYTSTSNFTGVLTPPTTNSINAGSYGDVTASVNFTNQTNLSSVTYTEDENSFTLDLKILSYYECIRTSGTGTYSASGSSTIHATGTCEKYTPKKVEISFYGDTISLDIKEENFNKQKEYNTGKPISFNDVNLSQSENYIPGETDAYVYVWSYETRPILGKYTLRLGRKDTKYKIRVTYKLSTVDDIRNATMEEGQSSVSIGGFQTGTNVECKVLDTFIYDYRIIDKNASDILSNYYNGKETAVIKCGVGEFLKESDLIAVGSQIHLVTGVTDFVLILEGHKPAPYDVFIEFILDGVKHFATIHKDQYRSEEHFSFDPNNYTHEILGVYSKVQVIEIGDIVKPMVYKNGGDVPMSIRYGRPKQFRVTGNKISYDGAIFQELTLQEV